MKLSYLYILLGSVIQLSGCSGCSKSGRIRPHTNAASKTDERTTSERTRSFNGKTIIKMRKEDGVYQIPVTINGSEMYFIFDTGAGMISISNVEATFLYKQGKLKDEDIIGKANFIDANGDISEGVVIKLKTVTLGNRTLYDVEASVVQNTRAPLLFGQSALEKFGKISIDYDKSEITFE